MLPWSEIRPSEDFHRVLRPDGTLAADPPPLTDDELLDLYRTFVRSRVLDEKMLKMQRRGELGLHARAIGEEATPLGSAAALEPGDWCFPYYRQTPARLYWGVPVARIVAGRKGFEPETVEEHAPPGESPVHFTPTYTPLAVNVTNAVGSAMADAFADRDVVSLAYVGDGATSEGDFHEAMNFAGVFDAPAVVVCQNNQWAVSVPAHRQTASETFARKADAYGVPGERVDGNDVLAVYERTRAAVDRARRGEGATLVECVTYRMGEHNTADNPDVYRDGTEAEYWAARDPVARFEAYLEGEGALDAERRRAIEADARERVEEGVERVRAIPPSEPERMFDHHLHDATWTERRQRRELRAELAGRNPFADAASDAEAWDAAPVEAAERTPFLRADGAPELNLVSAVREALRQEMARDDAVRLLGYDVGSLGGVFRATQGLYEEFGPDRVVDAPLSENGVLGTAVGMAMRGERVVPEIQFMGFLYPAFGQFMYAVAKTYERSAGALETPLTVRMPYGGGIRASEYHSESTEAFLVHTPGVRVVCPSTPYEAKGLLAASVRSPDPVCFLEPTRIYRGLSEPVPTDEYALPLDAARAVRTGEDVTVLAWGAMVRHAVDAAEAVDADVEVLDLRTLAPLDVEAVLASVAKTGRCVVVHEARRTLGLGAELSALVTRHLLDRLLAPVVRVTGYDVHFPGHQVEDAYLPDPERVARGVEAVMTYAA